MKYRCTKTFDLLEDDDTPVGQSVVTEEFAIPNELWTTMGDSRKCNTLISATSGFVANTTEQARSIAREVLGLVE